MAAEGVGGAAWRAAARVAAHVVGRTPTARTTGAAVAGPGMNSMERVSANKMPSATAVTWAVCRSVERKVAVTTPRALLVRLAWVRVTVPVTLMVTGVLGMGRP